MIVFIEGKQHEIKEPSRATLKKYGLTLNDWKELLACQGYICPICKRVPSSGRFVVDHIHVQNYKHMKAEKKRLWIRGIPCGHCNRFFLARGATPEKLMNASIYLSNFEKRRPK